MNIGLKMDFHLLQKRRKCNFFYCQMYLLIDVYIFMKGEASATPPPAPYMFCGDGGKTITVGAKQLTDIFPCSVIA